MSIEAENIQHEAEVESSQDEVRRRLDAIIFLLEVIAEREHTTLEEIE